MTHCKRCDLEFESIEQLERHTAFAHQQGTNIKLLWKPYPYTMGYNYSDYWIDRVEHRRLECIICKSFMSTKISESAQLTVWANQHRRQCFKTPST